MTESDIVSKVNEFLHAATGLTAEWLKKKLPSVSDDWWNDCVLARLKDSQKAMVVEKGLTALDELDLAALLRVADRNWYPMREHFFLPGSIRAGIQEMMNVRNRWAHCAGRLPEKAAIMDDLGTILEFCGSMECDIHLSAEIESFISRVEKADLSAESATVPVAGPTRKNGNAAEDAEPVQGTGEIKAGDMVYAVSDPGQQGVVVDVKRIGDVVRYDVFMGNAVRTFYPGQIALVEKTEARPTDADEFRCRLIAQQLKNPSSLTLYSLNSGRVDFVSYQFRPVLKLIQSDEPRLLIADSVGVGKTIEAGLIIKELEARGSLERVLIICPKALVTERKWENEMKRFDEEFFPMPKDELVNTINDVEIDGEWPARYGKAIISYSSLDSMIYDGDKTKKHRCKGLKNLNPKPRFDLVIVDEAHHIRNGSEQKDKAYAYKCVKYFCDNSDAVVMLTATPLQTSDYDLYTLLNVLRPDVVTGKGIYDLMSRPNKFISDCSKTMRAAQEGWQEKALDELTMVDTTNWGENVVTKNPRYAEAVEKLKTPDLSMEDRIALISTVESLHSFNNMINRTRRRDIQNFCVRRSGTLETPFTEYQQVLYDELLKFETTALTMLHGSRSVAFMISTVRRQAASCIFGLAPQMKNMLDRKFDALADDPDIDTDEFGADDEAMGILRSLAENVLHMAGNLPDEDPKFDSMLEVIEQKQEEHNNKIMLFSSFRHTLAYVGKKLKKAGYRVGQIDGSVKDDDRVALKERFEKDRDDRDAIDIMLFTEVGSEGLDYQFCNMMINYDLPWNPMAIEQRIGRIDRHGQTSDVVNIYNLITSGTVDADIYSRCLMRIGVFEHSIGECDEILGEINKEIERIAYNPSLTEEERNAMLQAVSENEVRKMQDMERFEEEQKGLFGIDLSSAAFSKDIQDAENPWLTPTNVMRLVQRYLSDRLGPGSYLLGSGDIKTLRLSREARNTLLEDCKKLPGTKSVVRRQWERYLKGTDTPTIQVTFEQDAARDRADVLFLTLSHPLVRQAADYFGGEEPMRVSLRYSDSGLEAGVYPFRIYLMNYRGFSMKAKLHMVCENRAVAGEWENIVSEAQTREDEPADADSVVWDALEVGQAAYWESERAAHRAEIKETGEYRKESLRNAYRVRINSLGQKIAEDVEPSIIKMHQGQLRSAEDELEGKINEIERTVESADVVSTLIASGYVTIEREGRNDGERS